MFRHAKLTCHSTRRRKHLNKVHGIAYGKLPPEPESTPEIARDKNWVGVVLNSCIMTSARLACAKFDLSNTRRGVIGGFVRLQT